MNWFQFILDNPDKPWNYHMLSYNPNITWDIVQANPDNPWDYYYLSLNPNITLDIVQANPDKPWNYEALSRNPNITLDIVQANPDKPWNYSWLSQNPMSKYEFPICIMKRRAKERISIIKEELLMKAFHPDRVSKWIKYYGINFDKFV